MKKATGMVRRIDDLRRLVLPVEILRTLDIEKNDALEIFVDGDQIILRKYNPGCYICGEITGFETYQGKMLCHKCIREIKELPNSHAKR